MIELLLAFSLWPWLLFIALLAALTVSAAMEATFIAFVASAIYGILSFLLLGVNPFSWIYLNPGSAILVAVLYVCVGVAWSLFKWRDHMTSDRIQSVLSDRRKAFEEAGGTEASQFRNGDYFPAIATAAYNKSRIINWIALWPFSAFMFVAYDLLSRFFGRLYDMLAGTYERMTSRYIP